jgi:hypothetical protein
VKPRAIVSALVGLALLLLTSWSAAFTAGVQLGSTAWSPLNLPKLVVTTNTGNVNTLRPGLAYVNGASVTSQYDLGGTGQVLTNAGLIVGGIAAAAPTVDTTVTLNGAPSLQFIGAAHPSTAFWDATPPAIGTSPHSIVLLVKVDSFLPAGVFTGFAIFGNPVRTIAGPGNTSILGMLNYGAAVEYWSGRNNDSIDNALNTIGSVDTSAHVVIKSYDGAKVSTYVDYVLTVADPGGGGFPNPYPDVGYNITDNGIGVTSYQLTGTADIASYHVWFAAWTMAALTATDLLNLQTWTHANFGVP